MKKLILIVSAGILVCIAGYYFSSKESSQLEKALLVERELKLEAKELVAKFGCEEPRVIKKEMLGADSEILKLSPSIIEVCARMKGVELIFHSVMFFSTEAIGIPIDDTQEMYSEIIE